MLRVATGRASRTARAIDKDINRTLEAHRKAKPDERGAINAKLAQLQTERRLALDAEFEREAAADAAAASAIAARRPFDRVAELARLNAENRVRELAGAGKYDSKTLDELTAVVRTFGVTTTLV